MGFRIWGSGLRVRVCVERHHLLLHVPIGVHLRFGEVGVWGG